MPKTPQTPTPSLQIDPQRYKVLASGRPVKLPPGEFRILAALAKANGKVLSRADLLESYHASQGARDIDSRAVDQHVARLRRNLGRDAAKAIVTVTNVGYKAEGIEVLKDAERFGVVSKIMRVVQPKKVGAYVTSWVEGDVLPNLREGHKFPLPA